MLVKYGVINDIHGPWHDPKSVEVALSVLEDLKVEYLIINGDLLDMYNVNSHGPKHPSVGTMLEDELAWGRMWLRDLRARFPKIHIVFLYGNHEDRLDRFLLKECKALYDSVRLDKLLNLDELGIEWYYYNHRYRVAKTNIYIQHSPPSYSKNGAMVSLERDIDQSSIYGCSHRMLMASKTGKSGEVYQCVYNGWLGSTNLSAEHRRIFSYIKGHESWQQCFSVVNVVDGSKGFIEQIPILGNRAFHGEYLYG